MCLSWIGCAPTEVYVAHDPSKLKERISAAESVLTSCLHAISHDPNASTERSKIENALANLRTLVRVSGIQAA